MANKYQTWAIGELASIKRAAKVHNYSLADSLSDAMSDGPYTAPELKALEEAIENDPDFGSSCMEVIDILERARPATQAESDAWWREQGGE